MAISKVHSPPIKGEIPISQKNPLAEFSDSFIRGNGSNSQLALLRDQLQLLLLPLDKSANRITGEKNIESLQKARQLYERQIEKLLINIQERSSSPDSKIIACYSPQVADRKSKDEEKEPNLESPARPPV